MKQNCQAFLCLIYFIGIVTANSFDPLEERSENIDVRPLGKKITEEKELEGYRCSFTYQAEGGTDEIWLMNLAVNEDKTKFSCSVERRMSYLFFESFELTVTGGKVIEGTVLGPEGKPLGIEEYKIDMEENKVSSVLGKFKSQLDKVELVVGKSGKEEL